MDEAKVPSVCLSVCVCLCVCVPLASDSSETIEGIIIKLDMVTASDMAMHRMVIILTVTSIQGHTENGKCLITSETVQANLHQVCCEDSPTKALYNLLSV